MKEKRYVLVPKKISGLELKEQIEKHFNAQVFNYVMAYFKKYPTKTCCHIPKLRLKVRKYGVDYTIEEA